MGSNRPRTLGFVGLTESPKSFTNPFVCASGFIAIGRGKEAARCAEPSPDVCSCRVSNSSCSELDNCVLFCHIPSDRDDASGRVFSSPSIAVVWGTISLAEAAIIDNCDEFWAAFEALASFDSESVWRAWAGDTAVAASLVDAVVTK